VGLVVRQGRWRFFEGGRAGERKEGVNRLELDEVEKKVDDATGENEYYAR